MFLSELLEQLSQARFVTEILVVDTSVDQAVKSALQSVPLKIRWLTIPTKAENLDFAALRNQTLLHTTTDWVLFLDSDERLDAQARRSLHELFSGFEPPKYDAYRIRRRDYFLGQPLKYGETGHVDFIRLAKKSGLHFERPVHEEARVFTTRVGRLDGCIEHFSHESVSSFLRKNQEYAWLAGRDLKWHRWRLLELILKPPFKFLYNYFWQLGFLDGYRGLVYAVAMSLHSFWVRIYSYESTNRPFRR